jgi:hypothetical protein
MAELAHTDNPTWPQVKAAVPGPPPALCAKDQVGVATPEAVQWPLPSAVM